MMTFRTAAGGLQRNKEPTERGPSEGRGQSEEVRGALGGLQAAQTTLARGVPRGL